MWFPRHAPTIVPFHQPKLEWLAIRQVEVMHEGCHIELFDMEMENFKRSLKFFNAARGRSQRLVVVIAGNYRNNRSNQDHLARFDHRFRGRLQSMINMLWLDEMNTVINRTSGMACCRPRNNNVLGHCHSDWPARLWRSRLVVSQGYWQTTAWRPSKDDRTKSCRTCSQTR